MPVTKITAVSTPPQIYANVLFSIPTIIGDMKMYEAHTYVINNAGNKPMSSGFLCFARYIVMHHRVMQASVWFIHAK
jgi:hypothetical protein